jgi:hypothetical protein
MTDIAIDLPPYLNAQISFDALIIRDAGVDDELEICIGVFGFRPAVPDSRYHL